MTHDRSDTRMWRCSLCGWLNPSDCRVCMSCEKKKPRTRRGKPPPVFRPWRCVVLALDTAERTGWSIWVLGKLAAHGEFRIYTDDGVRETVRVVDTAKDFAARLRVPWVCVSERSWGGYMGTDSTAAFGWWKFVLRNAQLPHARIGQVYPATWRARVLARGMHGAQRDKVRACEVATARALIGGKSVGDDEAPAILIGKWGVQAGEVGELLPKNARATV